MHIYAIKISALLNNKYSHRLFKVKIRECQDWSSIAPKHNSFRKTVIYRITKDNLDIKFVLQSHHIEVVKMLKKHIYKNNYAETKRVQTSCACEWNN